MTDLAAAATVGAVADELSRKRRKEDGKRNKRQRIQESGGVRPRSANSGDTTSHSKQTNKKKYENERHNQANDKTDGQAHDETFQPKPSSTSLGVSSHRRPLSHDDRTHSKTSFPLKHRFGRVMERVPCRNKPRFSSLSIALPGSVLANCQTRELRTLLVGQIARAATIYHVDEIVVFDDKLGSANGGHDGGNGFSNHRSGWRDFKRRGLNQDHEQAKHIETPLTRDDNNEKKSYEKEGQTVEDESHRRPRSDPSEFMCRLLQYCECPQYLRRNFFPMHPDLQFAGILAPTDAPHHVRADDHNKYREGIVLNKFSPSGKSLVNCGIRSRPVEIDRKLTPGIRCTVQIDPAAYGRPGLIKGIVVSPSAPREEDGTYWGYTTRMAASINEVFEGCPYDGGYDLKIGTSERGEKSVEEKNFTLRKYEHALIVFGGVAGIEECVDADESIKLPGSQSKKLFDMWLNVCPFQGSRTIRTEEAVMISLATLSPFLSKSGRDKEVPPEEEQQEDIEFSDEEVSDESSETSASSEDSRDGEGNK